MKTLNIILSFLVGGNVLAAEIAKLNTETCNMLRVERRAQIYSAVGINEIDSLNNKFLNTASAEEMNQLKSAANVPAFDPFWPSDETKKSDNESKNKFVQISSAIAKKMGTNMNGNQYIRADGKQENETPFIRLSSQNSKYRETFVAAKPGISTARVFSDTKQFKLDYLNKFPSMIFVVHQPLYDDKGAIPKPNVEIIAGNSSYNFSSLIEETMPENCKSSPIEYNAAFDSTEQNVNVVNDSSKNKLKENSGQQNSSEDSSSSNNINK